MAFDRMFASDDGDCDVWIEDDGHACYAYVLDADGTICGDVWLYNRGPAPLEFEKGDQTAPCNPAPFVDARAHFAPPNSIEEFRVGWARHGKTLFAKVFIRDKLAAILANGTTPGWSALAKRDGPVARVLTPRFAADHAAANAATGAVGAASSGSSLVELHDPGDGRNVLIEITRNNHRRGQNFKKHHPWAGQAPPRALVRHPRLLFRKIWEKDWDEGRFDHMKEQ